MTFDPHAKVVEVWPPPVTYENTHVSVKMTNNLHFNSPKDNTVTIREHSTNSTTNSLQTKASQVPVTPFNDATLK